MPVPSVVACVCWENICCNIGLYTLGDHVSTTFAMNTAYVLLRSGYADWEPASALAELLTGSVRGDESCSAGSQSFKACGKLLGMANTGGIPRKRDHLSLEPHQGTFVP